MKAFLGVAATLAAIVPASAQVTAPYPQGIFICDGVHPRCTWVDPSTYPYHQFGGRHVGQYSGVSDVLEAGPPLEHYQTFLAELISKRPDTNAVAFWADASSVVNNGRVWGGFFSARSGFTSPGMDNQLIGLEIDVLNAGLPGVYPNASKVGLQIVGFGNPNTNAIEVTTETASAAFQNIINIQPHTVALNGAVIGLAPNSMAYGFNFQGSTFSESALALSANAPITFRTPGFGQASIYRDELFGGYLVLQAGPPGLRIVNSENNTNLLIVQSDGDIITKWGRISSLFGAKPASVAVQAAVEPAALPAVVLGTTTGTQSVAVGAGSSATGANSVALGAGSTDSSEANVVSVGSDTQTRRVIYVSDGKAATDAANIRQVSQSLAEARSYTDSRFDQINFKLGANRKDAEGGTASAMAMAGIPQSFERGKGMIGMGVGTWQGESAIAVGLSKATDNGVVVKIGGTYNSRGQGGANGGFGVSF